MPHETSAVCKYRRHIIVFKIATVLKIFECLHVWSLVVDRSFFVEGSNSDTHKVLLFLGMIASLQILSEVHLTSSGVLATQ